MHGMPIVVAFRASTGRASCSNPLAQNRCFWLALIYMVVVVDRRDHLVPEPHVGILAHQQRIAEEVEVFGRIEFAFDQPGHLDALIRDPEGGVQAGNLQAIERRTPARR